MTLPFVIAYRLIIDKRGEGHTEARSPSDSPVILWVCKAECINAQNLFECRGASLEPIAYISPSQLYW